MVKPPKRSRASRPAPEGILRLRRRLSHEWRLLGGGIALGLCLLTASHWVVPVTAAVPAAAVPTVLPASVRAPLYAKGQPAVSEPVALASRRPVIRGVPTRPSGSEGFLPAVLRAAPAANAPTNPEPSTQDAPAPVFEALPLEPELAAWQRNAMPVAAADGAPMIAIIIDDVGLDRRRSEDVVAMPAPLTLSYLPYAADVAGQAADARRRGHELMLHMPMEPDDRGEDPGPNALLTNLPRGELMRRLKVNLARFDGYIGINNHMGSRFTADLGGMAEVMAELDHRGLAFVDSKTSGRSVGPHLAQSAGLPYLERDVFLDHDEAPGAVEAQFDILERIARSRGYAVAIGHPKDVTIAALRRWLPEFRRRGIAVVPVSAILKRDSVWARHDAPSGTRG